MPLHLSRRIYEATRARIIDLASQHYDISGHLEFKHNETGIRTLKDEFDLTQIEVALESKHSHPQRSPPNDSLTEGAGAYFALSLVRRR